MIVFVLYLVGKLGFDISVIFGVIFKLFVLFIYKMCVLVLVSVFSNCCVVFVIILWLFKVCLLIVVIIILLFVVVFVILFFVKLNLVIVILFCVILFMFFISVLIWWLCVNVFDVMWLLI